LLAACLLVAGITTFFVSRARSKPLDKSIAVLPFQNLSDDPENAFFALGIHDEVVTNLSKIRDLKVISRSSMMQYKRSTDSVRQIGQELGVATVLEGSVRRIGNRVRVTVQLINTTTDRHIWAETYERVLTDVAALQSELATQIASNLGSRLSPTERAALEAKPTDNPDAYLTYLQAQNILAAPTGRAELEQAAQLYRKAIELDPSFALAFARFSYLLGTIYQVDPTPRLAESVYATAREALRLNPELPEGHLALGYSFYRIERDYDRALHELKIAQAAMPNDSEIFLVLGSIARRQGNWTQSVADYQKGLSLNPKSAFLWMCLGGTHRAVRDFAAAARAYAKGAEIDPAFFMNRYYQARLEIEWRGDTKPMEQLLSAAPEADPPGRVLFARYELAILQRRFEEALRLVAESKLEKLAPYEPPAPVPRSSLVAKACRFLGRDDEARAAFGEAAQAIESSPDVNSAWRAVFLG